MSRILQVFCTLFSACTLSLAIPNELLRTGSPLIGLFALVPYYLAINACNSYKEAFFTAFLHGSTVHLFSSYWLAFFGDFAIFTLGASWLGTGFVEAFSSIFLFYIFSAIDNTKKLQLSSDNSSYLIPLKTIWFSSMYVLYEWIKSTGFLGYSWGTLYMTSYNWPLITQIADFTGPYGITFIFAFFSAVVGEGFIILVNSFSFEYKTNLITSYRQTFKVLFVLISLTVIYGAYQYTKTREQIKTLNVILVQNNRDQWNPDEKQSIIDAQNLTEDQVQSFEAEFDKKPDLIVWPEGSLAKHFPGAENYYSYFPEESPLIAFIKKINVPFIIGGAYTLNREQHKNANVSMLFDKRGRMQGYYAKLHLVPFAEAIPGVQYERVRKIIKAIAGFSYGWTGGSRYVLFEIPVSTPVKEDLSETKIISTSGKTSPKTPQTVTISTPICYDDAFEEVCRGLFLNGSEAFINITNDSWSMRSSAEIQHFVVASFRAVEYRTTLVRNTNSGYTAIIDPRGRVIKDLPLFESCATWAQIPIYKREITSYARFGAWMPKTIFIIGFIYILYCKLNKEE